MRESSAVADESTGDGATLVTLAFAGADAAAAGRAAAAATVDFFSLAPTLCSLRYGPRAPGRDPPVECRRFVTIVRKSFTRACSSSRKAELACVGAGGEDDMMSRECVAVHTDSEGSEVWRWPGLEVPGGGQGWRCLEVARVGGA